MPRGNTEVKEILRGVVITQGGVTRFSKELPMGEAWTRMMIRFNNVVVIGTGAGAIADGVWGILKGLTLRSDKNEFYSNAMPGRAIRIFARIMRGTDPPFDTVSAASLTFRVMVELWFIDPLATMPIDTILNTRRYSSMQLEISYGGLADFYTAPGTATLAVTADIMVERFRGPLPQNKWPRMYMEHAVRAPIDPTVLQTIDMERAAGLAYKRWIVNGSVAAAVPAPAAGVPFSTVGSDSVINDITSDHDAGRPYDTTLYDVVQRLNKQFYTLEANLLGTVVLDFMTDGSHQSMLYSGNKSRLRALWTNFAGVAVGSQVSLAYQGVRPLVPA